MIQTYKGSRKKSTLTSGLVLVTSLRAQRWRWRRQKTQLHEGWTDHREAPLKGRRCLWIHKPENLPRLSTTATNKKKIKLMLRTWFENVQKNFVTIGMCYKWTTKVPSGNIQTLTLYWHPNIRIHILHTLVLTRIYFFKQPRASLIGDHVLYSYDLMCDSGVILQGEIRC